MIATSRTALVLIFAASALAACKSENGYVEIKTVPVPSRAQPPMYLDSSRLPQITKGTVVLAHPVGTVRLQIEASDGNPIPLCDIAVRKDRITTVFLSVLESPPRCQCRISGGRGRICVS